MFARKVSLQLKHNSTKDFTKKLESDVIPLLRKQQGFQDEITFTARDGKEAFGISLWDRKESAEAYGNGPYTQVQKMLEDVIDGTPRIETYEVSTSTCHKVGAGSVR
jgi:heme-degrading monooxygenase HmoA